MNNAGGSAIQNNSLQRYQYLTILQSSTRHRSWRGDSTTTFFTLPVLDNLAKLHAS